MERANDKDFFPNWIHRTAKIRPFVRSRFSGNEHGAQRLGQGWVANRPGPPSLRYSPSQQQREAEDQRNTQALVSDRHSIVVWDEVPGTHDSWRRALRYEPDDLCASQSSHGHLA
jgi:hypothetical protein